MNFIYNDGGRLDAGYIGSAGDCVCRAIAIATGKTYQEVYDTLNTTRDSMRQTKRIRGTTARDGAAKPVYEKYLSELGWSWTPTMKIGSGCRVHLKTGELPHGNLIVRVSKHMIAVINGVINDTYDCSRQGTRCVYGYYSKE